mmetsp:Transcript_61784/g.172564  ORF Transcript_61784/g.172564 Transcript_61784/m.172564 type:complete len:381 (-) Transcript_61784:98-1240(-)|eukprot:CAMPEP_0117528216 /NCGR_PEP_ID=MMETSP0784-20121206/37198_1 /TAXON_ID=39447 /ORGANISM="" /LENGTH=380 /DNA_ID=CAMNT_0005324491 /DNA_START=79 /DNA_END=1221 /DNA_ORIENTATION=-
MAPKVAKRGRPAASGGAAKRKRSEAECQVEEVVAALKPCGGLTADILEALKDAAPYCLSAYADKRHPYQAEIVGMIEQTFAEIEAFMQKNVDEASGAIMSRDQVEVSREAVVNAAARDVAGKTAEVAKLEAEVIAADMKYRKASKVFREKEKEQKTGDKAVMALEKDKASLSSIVDQLIGPMKLVAASANETSKLKTALGPFLKDSSLLNSLQMALGKEPTERTEFDAKVINNLDAMVSAKLVEFDAALEDATPEKNARVTVVEDARAAHDAAKARFDGAKDSLRTAETAKTAARKVLEDAMKAQKGFDDEIAQAVAHFEDHKVRLMDFQSGPKVALALLKTNVEHVVEIMEDQEEADVAATMPDTVPEPEPVAAEGATA